MNLDLERQLKNMKKYEHEMIDILSALNESGALKHVVVAGSWATYFYKYIFESFIPRAETTDFDLYLPDPKRASGISLTEKLINKSFKRIDACLTSKTIFTSDAGFSIEFLTIPDRTMSPTIRIKGLDIVAEALPKMAPVGWNYVQIEFGGFVVNVVSPVSFVLQKLLINNERKPEFKKEKDIEAIKYLLPFILASQKYSSELKDAFEKYPKKWRRTIIETARSNDIELLEL